ncbi:MAG: tetratricopeptide repeat protein [Treponema sp.]|nr:tetratricopeptide repeat protein [Treponema sp.]
MNKFKTGIIIALLFLTFFPCAASTTGQNTFMQGCEAYSRGDWESAVILLRKAIQYSENNTDDAKYMLITAEIYSGDNKSALADCDDFLKTYRRSLYKDRVLYLKGKLLYLLGDYENAIMILSDFCHKNEKNELYPSALFYIAESLNAGYKYDEAEAIYERIIVQFPGNEKVSASQYRIESIAQRSREEKLLYLLKQTGEEYLAAKEDYERQLKLYNAEGAGSTRDRLADAQQRNRELEEQVKELENQIALLKAEREKREAEDQRVESENEKAALQKEKDNEDAVRKLKQKAKVVRQIMDMTQK